MKFLTDIRLLLIALWLGAACFFSFAVAPGAFAVLESRELAGAVVSRTLTIVNLSGLVTGLLLLAASFIKSKEIAPFWIWTERFLLLILTAACAVGQFVIALWLSLIRARIGRPIEEVPLEDPLRIQFNNLHQYSVWVLAAAMIAALLAFFIISNRKLRAVKTKNSADFDFQKEFNIKS